MNTHRSTALLACLALAAGCSSYDPGQLDAKHELTALEKVWGGKGAGYSILVVPIRAPVSAPPSDEETQSQDIRCDTTALHAELIESIKRVVGPGDRVELAAASDPKLAAREAWRRGFDLLLKVQVDTWRGEFVKTNGWWFPNALFLAWYLWPIGPQWWIADEDYGVNLSLKVVVEDVASENPLPSLRGRTVTVHSAAPRKGRLEPLHVVPPPVLSLDDLDRGLDLFGTWISGSLDADQWEQVGEKLGPYAVRHAAVRVAAAVGDGLDRLRKLDPKLKARMLSTTHALVVGISEYPGARCPGAVADAERFARLLRGELPARGPQGKARAGSAPRWAPEKNVTLLRNGEASLKGIAAALERIQASSRPQDRVVVYFAGSGWSRRGKGLAGLALRTLPAKARGKGRVGFTLADLARRLERIKARERLVVIDADFRQGGARGGRGRGRLPGRDQLRALLRDAFLGGGRARGGVVLATSLGASERVQTFEEEGLLTRYLVRAFQGEADLGRDGLTFRDLESYLERHVVHLSAVALPRRQRPLVVGKTPSARVH